MEKIFLSCLGTTDYTEVEYSLPDEPGIVTRFVQLARLKMLLQAGIPIDKAYIFLTEKARLANWEESDARKGLKQCLKDLDLRAEPVEIPDGSSPSEFWQFFETVCERIPSQSEVYVDLTHGFRTQPILLLLALEFVQRIRDVSIKELTYGALVGQGPQAVWDLSAFLVIREWADASRSFRETGSTEAFARLTKLPIRQYGKKHKQTPKILSALCNALAEFGAAIAKCAARKLPESSTLLKRLLVESQSECQKIQELKPLVLVLDSMREALAAFPDTVQSVKDELKVQAAAVRWCLDHRQFMQAMTFTREAYVTALCQLSGEQRPRLEADEIFGALEVYSRKKSLAGLRQNWCKPHIESWHKNPPIASCLWESFIQTLSSLLSIRNGFDHAHTDQSQAPKTDEELKTKGEEFLSALQGLIDGLILRETEGASA